MKEYLVPAFPYEGALFWLFAERGTSSYQGDHAYYVGLYGPDHRYLVSKTLALASLFEQIVLAPADAQMPDYRSYSTGRSYYHPDLRLSLDWKYNEWDKDNIAIANDLLRQRTILDAFALDPQFPDDEFVRRHFLCRTLLQIEVATDKNAVLLGNSFYRTLHDAVCVEIGKGTTVSDRAEPWSLDADFMNVVGLDFGSESIDAFAAVRQSKEISKYASEYRKALASSWSSPDFEQSLIDLIEKSLEVDEIAEKAQGAFSTVGSIANVVGLIPIIGNIAAGIGIGSDVASRSAREVETRKEWYLIGPKMREISIKDAVARKAGADDQ